MIEKLQIKDKQNFICDPNYADVIQGEQLLWSGLSYKINVRGRKQNRIFLLTTARVLNIGKKNFWNNLKFWQKFVKRAIKVENITSITYSNISNNFILHVPSEYDYYLSCQDKDEFIEYLLTVLLSKGIKEIDFYDVEDIDLSKYTKNEGEKKMKYPSVTPKKVSLQNF